MSVKLSIVTATRNLIKANRVDQILRCLESVAALPFDHEHIVCDGASTDGTVELIRKLSVRVGGGVRLLSEPDVGIYDAFNKGVRAATGEWVYFLGSDDYVFDPAVMGEVWFEASRSSAEFVISPVRHSDGSCYFSSLKDFGNILILKTYCHQGVLMKKKLIERLGMFDTSYKIAADFKMCLRAHLANVKCLVIWKRYTEFAIAGGVSNSGVLEYDERVSIPTELLGLTEKESLRLRLKQLLPLRVIARYLVHPNSVVRFGAFYALVRRCANLIGLLDEHGAPRRLCVRHMVGFRSKKVGN